MVFIPLVILPYKWLTRTEPRSPCPERVSVWKPLWVLIHWSSYTWILESLATFYIPSFWSISRPTRRLDQSHDALPPFGDDKKSPLEKYNPFITLTHNEVGSFNTLSPSLLIALYWKPWTSLKPNPPTSFLLVIISHIFQWIFLLVSDLPQQKFAIIELIAAHHVLGR